MAAETAQFAAVCRAAAPLSLIAGGRRRRSPASLTHSSKPAAPACAGRMIGQTNGRTPGSFIDPVPHTKWITVASHQLNSHKRLSTQCKQSFALGLGN